MCHGEHMEIREPQSDSPYLPPRWKQNIFVDLILCMTEWIAGMLASRNSSVSASVFL